VRGRLDDSGGGAGKVKPLHAWYVLILLTAIYGLSFLDRSLLSLVIGLIKVDLDASDLQLSLLLGLSFVLLYCLFSIPAGHFVDRYNRSWIIAGAIALWSTMELLCGLAGSYGQLFVARAGLGIGEAAVSPAAYSIIRDKEPPPFPDFEFTGLPANHVRPLRGIIHTNWLQELEALLDAAHVGYLHSSNLGSDVGRAHFKAESDYMLDNGAPEFEFEEKPYGFREGALRRLKDGGCYARIREVALPFFSFIPATPGTQSLVCCSIPIDDEWTAQWYIAYNPAAPIDPNRMRAYGTDSGNPDFFNSDMGNAGNLWNQDRAAMKADHWSGIVGRGNAYEDFVVQESMGPIVDRTKEFLGSPDIVIVRARRKLLAAVRAFEATGEVPFDGGDAGFSRIRAISAQCAPGQSWRDIDPFSLRQLAAAE
jgi:hypothetical protein